MRLLRLCLRNLEIDFHQCLITVSKNRGTWVKDFAFFRKFDVLKANICSVSIFRILQIWNLLIFIRQCINSSEHVHVLL